MNPDWKTWRNNCWGIVYL